MFFYFTKSQKTFENIYCKKEKEKKITHKIQFDPIHDIQ